MEKQTERSAESQNRTSTDTSLSQVEDAVMKTAIQYFGDELLTFLGIEGTTAYITPTEQVHLDLKKQYQDFNLVMEDGSWKHFEFQSTIFSFEHKCSFGNNKLITRMTSLIKAR